MGAVRSNLRGLKAEQGLRQKPLLPSTDSTASASVDLVLNLPLTLPLTLPLSCLLSWPCSTLSHLALYYLAGR